MISVPIASQLNDLAVDVLITSPSDGQLLTYVSSASKWENVSIDLSGYVPTSRTVNGHALSSNVTITAGDLSLGNVENTALSTWAGSANITTLGTIGTGVWSGTAVGITKGGTGQTTANNAFNALVPSQVGNSGKYLTTNATDTSWGTVTVPTGANPTGSVGLSAVNGSASTFMRSDGTPTLSQSIIPTWTGLHTFSNAISINSGATGTVAGIFDTPASPTVDIVQFKNNTSLKALIRTTGAFYCEGPATDTIFSGNVTTGNYSFAGGQGYWAIRTGTAFDFNIDQYTLASTPINTFKLTRNGSASFIQAVHTSGSPTALTVTGGAHTTLTASTESIGANLNFSATKQFATGAITTQREVVIQAPTYSAVGASIITTAATLAVTGAPIAGTNVTITNPYAFWVQGGASLFDGKTTVAVASGSGVTALTVTGPTSGPIATLSVSGTGDGNGGTIAINNPNTYGGITIYETSSIRGTLAYGDGGSILTGAGTNSISLRSENALHFSGGGDKLALTLDTTGLVAIGFRQTSPLSQLHVFQPATGTKAQIVQGIASRTAPLLQLQTSAGASIGNVGGSIFDHFTDTASTSTDGTENDLYSDTTVANTFAVDGDSIYNTMYISFTGSATATRRLRLYFAGTTIWDSGTLTLGAGGDFTLTTLIERESSTVVRCNVSVQTTSASTVPYSTYTRITGLTLTTTNIFKATGVAAGVGASSGDITAKLSKTEWFAAA